jgi:periplasmic divalent cation tolerance protein
MAVAVVTQALLVLTTCANHEQAASLADSLVQRRLAACVNTVNGITSTYRWQDRIEHDEESLLLIKTTDDRFEAVRDAIRERSSYEVAEVLAVRVHAGSADYLGWLGACVEER